MSTVHCIPIVGVGKRDARITDTFDMPTFSNSGCEKRGVHMNWSMVMQRQHPLLNYVHDHWPCASGLSAVNAIGAQLRDAINSGMTQWRMAVNINK